jgi:small subunit ribosomal protein S3
MGQKVPPRANRLGVIDDPDSTTYASFRSGEFAAILQEDTLIRAYLNKKLKNAGVCKILIQRKIGQVQINAVVARPGLVFGKAGDTLDILKKDITAIINRADLTVNLQIFEVDKIDLDANLVAQFIAQQLERRVAFRRAVKQAMQRTMRAGAKGIKVLVSGRLGGIEIARSEKDQEGSVPCHTWRADIDYSVYEAKTTYGIIGVKVWINKGMLKPGEKSRKNIKRQSRRYHSTC